MIKRVLSILGVIILLGGGVPNFQVSANTSPYFGSPNLFSSLGSGNNVTLTSSDTISTKAGKIYDESKDPALRKGTENWEEPQGSYFAIPALVVAVIGLALFFNRDKSS